MTVPSEIIRSTEANGQPSPIKVDVWSDIACPWCYIGKRRFEAGRDLVAADPGVPGVEVEYHSFQLAPEMPDDFDGGEVDFLTRHKGMPADQVRSMLDHVTAVARTVGLAFDFEAMRPANTAAAHELLHLAKVQECQDAMKERLLRAHFEEGRHVGRHEDLAALAAEVGLDSDVVRAALAEGRYRPEVIADVERARAHGISGVPFYVFDGRYAVSGAQEPAAFAEVLRQVAASRAAAADGGEGRP